MKVDGLFRDIKFRDVKCGEVFLFAGKPYMRVVGYDVPPGTTPAATAQPQFINAINMESGHGRRIAEETDVIHKPLARLLLEGRVVPKEDRRDESKSATETPT